MHENRLSQAELAGQLQKATPQRSFSDPDQPDRFAPTPQFGTEVNGKQWVLLLFRSSDTPEHQSAIRNVQSFSGFRTSFYAPISCAVHSIVNDLDSLGRALAKPGNEVPPRVSSHNDMFGLEMPQHCCREAIAEST